MRLWSLCHRTSSSSSPDGPQSSFIVVKETQSHGSGFVTPQLTSRVPARGFTRWSRRSEYLTAKTAPACSSDARSLILG
jgi:hypothetical protein